MISGPQRAQTAVVCLWSIIALAASQDCFPRPCLPCQHLTNAHILLCFSALGSPPASCVSSASPRQPFAWRTPRAQPCWDSSSRSALAAHPCLDPALRDVPTTAGKSPRSGRFCRKRQSRQKLCI